MQLPGTNLLPAPSRTCATTDWVARFDRLGIAAALVDDGADILQAGSRFSRLFPRSESLLDPFSRSDRIELLSALCQVFQTDAPAVITLAPRLTLAAGPRPEVDVWLLPVMRSGKRAILALCDTGETRSDGEPGDLSLTELSGTVHDVNNLLTAAIGCAELLACHEYYDEALERDAEELREVLGRAGKLMRQLMAELRGEQTRHQRIQDPGRWLRAREGLFRGIAGNVSLRIDIEPDCWPVAFDEDRFEQVMINLVTNARDACAGRGEITIAARNVVQYGPVADGPHHNRFVSLSVTDTGCGVDLGQADRLFEPGYTSKPDGHGLGLAHSLAYLQELGATVEVQARPGNGTRFDIQLPAATIPAPPPNVLPLNPDPKKP